VVGPNLCIKTAGRRRDHFGRLLQLAYTHERRTRARGAVVLLLLLSFGVDEVVHMGW
jgi:hypothetical protein